MAGYQDPQRERGRSKWMWGCCGGCAGVALVALVGVGVFIYFMVRARPVAPPQTFFNTGADALAVLQVRPEDEAMANLLVHLAKNPPAAMDLSAEEKRRLQSQAEQIPENLDSMTPIQFVLLARHLDQAPASEEAPEGGEMEVVQELAAGLGAKKRFEYAGVASLKPYSGFVRWIFSTLIQSYPEKGGRTETYEGVTVGVPPSENFYLAAMDNNFLFAEKKDLLTGWIDALEKQKKQPKQEGEGMALPPYSGPEVLKAMYERLDHTAPLYLATSNAHGEIGDFAAILAEYKGEDEGDERKKRLKELSDLIRATGVDSDRVEVLGGSFSLSGPDTALIEIYAECATPDFAQGLSARLADGIGKMIQGTENVTIDPKPRSTLAHVTVTIKNVQEALRAMGKERQQPQEQGQGKESGG